MDEAVLRRVVAASVAAALVAGGVVVLLGSSLFDPVLAIPAIAGSVLLCAAHLFRAAATLRRSKQFSGISARILATTGLSIALTSLALSLLAGGLGNDSDCNVLGCIVGAVAWFRLADGHVLDWAPCPREAAHRRLKSRLFSDLFLSLYSAALCVVVAALVDGSSVLQGLLSARLTAGVLVLLAGEVQAEALQGCTALASAGPPGAADLAGALSQPLGVSGQNLGRWAALTALAQAVAHRQCGTFPGVRAGTGMGIGADASSSAYAVPPLAAEVFGRGGGASGLGLKAAPQSVSSYNTLLGSPQLNAPSGAAASQGTLFGTYLVSGLEVVREFTVRVQCLVGTARRKGAYALLPAQIAALDAQAVELLPLVKVSISGLVGWICLSRDLDDSGVVQREQALQRVLVELCGAQCALRDLSLLRGVLDMSADQILAAQEEVRHSLEQLLLAFRDAGLEQVHLPPAYKHLVMEMCR